MNIKQVRRNLINTCPKLTFFDDRPVEQIDRMCAEAWLEAGKDKAGLAAEREVRGKFMREKQDKFTKCSLDMHQKG